MSASTGDCVVFRAPELLPDDWRGLTGDGPVRTFNPGLLRDGANWIFAYRIVAADGLRRIGICRLDAQLRVIHGSQTPMTDDVRFQPDSTYPEIARQWFADPRLYQFGGRLFIYWNSGWHEPHNHQFLQELDSSSLRPIGYARELLLQGERQKLEKNWTFFGGDGDDCHAVYSITPHRVMTFSLRGDGAIRINDDAMTPWSLNNYPKSHGGLRGGAPPVLAEGSYWSFCHSVHDAPGGYRYAPAVYAFSPRSPYEPLLGPITTLALGERSGSKREYDRLNPAVGDVVYPCGAARVDARWFVSHGINDECCAISIVEHSSVCATVRPVMTSPPTVEEKTS